MKAMILAAGLGTRLGAITQTTPKCLVEAGGATLLEHTFRALKSAGVTGVIINLYHLAEEVLDFVSAHPPEGLDVRFSVEHELLGTGGGILRASHFFEDVDLFIVHNADVYSTVDVPAMIERHRSAGALATLAVMERTSSRPLFFDRSNRLVGWRNGDEVHPAGLATEPLREYGFTGIHVISRELLPVLAGEKPPFSIITSYMKAAESGGKIIGCPVTGSYWIDAGTPERLEELRKHLGGR